MTTFRVLWHYVLRQSKWLILLLVLSSSVFAFAVVPLWLQKGYLDKVTLYLNNETTLSTVLLSLLYLYVARSITGGFLTPFGQAKDLYYEYILIRNTLLSQFETSNRLKLQYYESETMFNIISRAKDALTSGALRQVINTLGAVLTLTINLLAMIGSLYMLNPIFALVTVISILPIFIEQIFFIGKIVRMRKRIVEINRKQEQCVKHIIDKSYVLETRISNASKYFIEKCEKYRKEVEKEEMRLQTTKLWFELLSNLFKSLCVIGVIIYAIKLMAEGRISIGGFSAVIGILSIIHGSTGYFISRISHVYSQYKELEEISKYFDMEKQNESGNRIKVIGDITLDNVSFKYPSRDTYAIKNINGIFKKGEKIAILGINGAGKSTLIKVILGLYEPTNGNVLYGKEDISDLDKPLLYKKMAAVFQDFHTYNISIEDNIIFGKQTGAMDNRVKEVLDASGFDYVKYKDKEKTFIGKDFNGIELSRGESQKVAIARCYYNEEAEVIVIDEPTAALDPIAEERLYEKFLELAGSKTTFIISHRLGSVRVADRILVMNRAEIIEDGTHEELIQANGLYADMFRRQASLYLR